MKGIVVGYKGTEDILKKEIKELISRDAKKEDSVAIFDTKKEELCKLVYLGQSFLYVLELLDSYYFETLYDLKINFDTSILKNKTFKVSCTRIGEHDFSSIDVAEKLGELIFESTKTKVSFKNPEMIIFCYIYHNKCYIGIDYAGIDLSKRDYKVFLHPEAMKGPIAYCLVRLAGFEPGMILLDPFCGSGIIPIEAAFYSTKFPINHYRKDKLWFVEKNIIDKESLAKFDEKKKLKGKIFGMDSQMRHMENAKQNAKIGGVEKDIEFSRQDIEWIDTKFEEKSVDLIVTDPPHMTSYNEKKVNKLYKELFYQGKYILKDSGLILVVASDVITESADGFELVKKIIIEKKKHAVNALIFKKKNI